MSYRNPYVNGMTEEEVAHAEENFYYIQVGEEVATSSEGFHTFKKEKAEYLFSELWAGMSHMVKHGTQVDRAIALEGLKYFYIHKLRIH